MSLLADIEILKLAEQGMIEPFHPERLNSYGYDVGLANEFVIPKPDYVKQTIVDPLNMDWKNYQRIESDICLIPPNSFVLGRSEEYFNIPQDLLGICLGRSSYARAGIIVNVTPLEPCWRGYITIEISNTNSLPAKVYAGKGIIQVIFLRASTLCSRPYLGRYQDQIGITLAKGL